MMNNSVRAFRAGWGSNHHNVYIQLFSVIFPAIGVWPGVRMRVSKQYNKVQLGEKVDTNVSRLPSFIFTSVPLSVCARKNNPLVQASGRQSAHGWEDRDWTSVCATVGLAGKKAGDTLCSWKNTSGVIVQFQLIDDGWCSYCTEASRRHSSTQEGSEQIPDSALVRRTGGWTVKRGRARGNDGGERPTLASRDNPVF